MAAVVSAAVAQDTAEKISIEVGVPKVIDLPFACENFLRTSTDVLDVEDLTGRQLRLTGKKPGICDLVVNGGGLSKRYSVTVLNEIRKIFDGLRTSLDSMPELELVIINQDHIEVRGEVSDPERWKLLWRVMERYDKKVVQNLTTFRPKPETLMNLKKMLTDSNFTLTDDAFPKEAGIIGFGYSADAITITGQMYCQGDIAKVQQILATQDWLTTGELTEDKRERDGKIKLVFNLTVKPVMIDVGTVYVGVSDDNVKQIGSENTFSIIGDFGTLANLLRGGGASHQATLGAGLNPTVRFLAENGVSRFKTGAHLTFISNEEGTTSFHQGGTTSVRVQGVNSGDLKEIPYGLTMSISGGLIGGNEVKLRLSLNRSEQPEINAGGDYNQRQSNVETSFVCKLGETVVLAGMNEITETTGNRGLPYLRNVPVLSWFVSTKGEQLANMKLLVLISPRLATQDVNIAIPPSAETADTLSLAETPNKERIKTDQAKKPWYKRIF